MKPRIITISRRYGSGGRFIGQELGKRLSIPCYDRSFFAEAAKRGHISESYFAEAESKNNKIYAAFNNAFALPYYMPLGDQAFLDQVTTMQELAEQGPCILVGRGGNKILKNRDDVLNVYIYADRETRLKRIIEEYGVNPDVAEKQLEQTDKNRRNYLMLYTDQKFGRTENYHLCIDSGDRKSVV